MRTYSAWWTAAVMLGCAGASHGATFDYCVRGSGLELQKTVRVKLELQGADPGADASRIAAALLRRLLWEGKAERVTVAVFDVRGCAAALGRVESIQLSMSADELERFRAEATRGGPGEARAATALAQGAKTTVLEPGPVAPGAIASPDGSFYTLEVLYATDRADTGTASTSDAGSRYGADRGTVVSFGVAQVTVPREHRNGQLETPSITKLEFSPDPKRHFTVRAVQPLSPDAWQRELRERAGAHGGPGILLFIHGFNVTFADAALRTAQLTYDLGFPGVGMFYSWPSRGALLQYNADQQTAEWAIPNLQGLLADITSQAPRVPVYVVAHSMGNRVFTRALERLLTEHPSRGRAFQEIVLTAPDIDADVFRRQVAPRIVGAGPRVTLYASDNDTALSTARRISAGYRRLGQAGDGIVVMPGMDTVDATNVKTDFLGHSYFGDSKTVMSDLYQLLRTGKTPANRGVLVPAEAPAGPFWRFPH